MIIVCLLKSIEVRYYTMLIHNKEDIEFVTEFPCLLGHPVLTSKDERDILIFTAENLVLEDSRLECTYTVYTPY